MADSSLKLIDFAMRAMVWYKFADLLSVTSMTNDSALWPKSVAFRHISEKRGAVQMEFMNIWRIGTKFDWSRQRTSVARGGVYGQGSDTGSTSLKAVPLLLSYDAYFWSKDVNVLNQITERYCFWQHQDPNLNMILDGKYPAEFDLQFDAVTDESPIEGTFEKGVYYVIRCPITVEGWITSSHDSKTIRTIYLKGYDASLDATSGIEISTVAVKSGLGLETGTGTETVSVVKS